MMKMKRIALIAAVMLFTACAGKPAQGGGDETAAVTAAAGTDSTSAAGEVFGCDDAAQEMITELDFPSMIKVEREAVGDYIDFELPEENDFAMYICASGGFSDEFLIVETGGIDTAALEKAVTDRVSARYTDFEDYVPEEAEKLNNAIVSQMPGYFMYFVTADNDRCVQIAEELLHR